MFALQAAVMKGRGGVLTSLGHYAQMFDAVGVDSVCLYRGPAADALRGKGLRVIDAPASLTSPFSALAPDLHALRRDIRAAGDGAEPDIIMAHSDMALGALRRMFPHAVLITRCHSDKTKRKREADIVVTLNPDQHKRVTRELAGSRARTLMLGHPFMMSPETRAVSGEGPARINFAARFVPAKDPLTFARAIGLMRTRPLPHVRVTGAGPLEGEIRTILAEHGVEAEFPGWSPTPFADFTGNDILVLPSAWEGLPWLLLEAQARAISTIASDISGNVLALGEGAYGDLFAAGDAAALAERIDAALADPSVLRAKAERGRADLAGRFGPQAFWNGLQEAMAAVREGRGRNA